MGTPTTGAAWSVMHSVSLITKKIFREKHKSFQGFSYAGDEDEENKSDTDEDRACTEGKEGECFVDSNYCDG